MNLVSLIHIWKLRGERPAHIEALQLRAWTEDPALSAEDRRFFKNYLTLARKEKRRAQKLVRHMKGKAA